MENVQNRIEKIINKLRKESTNQINLEEDLFGSGVLDSFGMISFISQIEEEFNINIPNEDLIPQNFWNIKSITETVRKNMK
ncbi:MAG: hypothetical protein A2287_00040 [Candidatus Melainabacteria bacterium RIFOXYA12_FULL_32_12]|nr:MAG: hypothetical protein A2255_10790 [Candidatus Melainabacteria bacterium RIFOXYA2_FULL_32_9]OGI31803.1 MAG: hypothetical protein A2287_00040 [Candidatus Melainabacteria bacterium RIFOXYA12_FULL_32_12]